MQKNGLGCEQVKGVCLRRDMRRVRARVVMYDDRKGFGRTFLLKLKKNCSLN